VEKILEDVVKKIKVRLKEINMSQEQFSIELGKGKSWFTALPHVQCDIKLKDFMRASEILKVEPSFLLGGNLSSSICNMSMEEMIKMLVKQECENYLKEKVENITNLLKHIRKTNET